ncbi:MAG: MFS transporter [Bdellovibrionales bacterium]|nr:MFS transporter [Bdellovibrionales bacterium]
MLNKSFKFIFFTQFFGALNDNIFKNALVLLLTYKSIELWNLDSGLLVPLAGLVFIFPFFVFSATAGQIADKYPKALVMKIVKFVEVIIMSIAACGFYFNNYQYLFIALFLMGAQSAFFGPVKYGILPFVAEKGSLVKANSIITSSTFLAILIGTILGGVFVSSGNSLYIMLSILLVSVFGLVSSLKIKEVKTETTKYKIDYTFFRSTLKTLKLSFENKDIFFTILGASWLWFMGAAILSVLPLFCKNILGVNAEIGTFFLSLFTLGMGIGAIIVKYISSSKVEIGVVPVAGFFLSLFLLDLSYISSVFVIPESESLMSFSVFFIQKYSLRAAIDVLFLSICSACLIIPQTTYIQEACDKKLISRIISANNIWNALFMVLASVLVMLLNSYGISIIFLVLALINLLASLFIYLFKPSHCLRFCVNTIIKIFYKIELVNFCKLPKKGPYILASNHISFADPFIVGGIIKDPVCYVMDWAYYYKMPFFFKQAGAIPIATSRESEEVLKKAFGVMKTTLDRGAILGIFPEGEISRTGEMRAFRPGIQRILSSHSVPVVLCAIDGLWGSIFSFESGKVLFKWPKSFRRKITLTLSDTILPGDYNSKDSENFFKKTVSNYKF